MNKSKVQKELSGVLNNAILWVRLDDGVSNILADILKLHPDYKEKVGVGVKEFFVRPASYGKRCFGIRRIDGSTTDFSYRKCLSNSTRALVMSVARGAIVEQMRDCLRKNHVCNCGCVAQHAHHSDRSFVTLFRCWLMQSGLSLSDVGMTSNENETETHFTDIEQEKSWQIYHSNNAVLVPLCDQCHKKKHQIRQ